MLPVLQHNVMPVRLWLMHFIVLLGSWRERVLPYSIKRQHFFSCFMSVRTASQTERENDVDLIQHFTYGTQEHGCLYLLYNNLRYIIQYSQEKEAILGFLCQENSLTLNTHIQRNCHFQIASVDTGGNKLLLSYVSIKFTVMSTFCARFYNCFPANIRHFLCSVLALFISVHILACFGSAVAALPMPFC